jgi:hypothetical protein
MREAARAVAEKYSWNRFREEIRGALFSFMNQDAASFAEPGYETPAAVRDFA